MAKATNLYVMFKLLGKHRWPDAPAEVAFLREPHSHRFGCGVTFPVSGIDREYEFFMVRKELLERIRAYYIEEESCPFTLRPGGNCMHVVDDTGDTPRTYVIDFGTRSCEQIANEIGEVFLGLYPDIDHVEVTVAEDAIQGAECMVSRDEKHDADEK